MEFQDRGMFDHPDEYLTVEVGCCCGVTVGKLYELWNVGGPSERIERTLKYLEMVEEATVKWNKRVT